MWRPPGPAPRPAPAPSAPPPREPRPAAAEAPRLTAGRAGHRGPAWAKEQRRLFDGAAMHGSFFAPPPANASEGAAGAVGSAPGAALAPYVRQLCPAWERQLCDAHASALLPDLDCVGVGLELALVRPPPPPPLVLSGHAASLTPY